MFNAFRNAVIRKLDSTNPAPVSQEEYFAFGAATMRARQQYAARTDAMFKDLLKK